MKHWTKDDLILFYYGELSQDQNESLRKALAESQALQQEYAELCDFLDNDIRDEVPEPSNNFNQQIMAAVYQQAEKQSETKSEVKQNNTIFQVINGLFNPRLLATTFALGFVVISVFYLGRWSSQIEQGPDIAGSTQQEPANPATNDNDLAQYGQRVLFNNVSTHIEQSSRLLTLVSNGNGDLASQIESRRKAIEELVALNRLYRRVAESSGDKQLANVLQQMESILVELNHTSPQAKTDELLNIKQRVEDTDLIFKLKVTNKKLTQKII